MTTVITGATGHLGRLVVSSLLRRGAAPEGIVAAGRSVDRLADLAGRGVRVAAIDFDDPASLRAAFTGARRLLLVSAPRLGRRVEQHTAAIDAARAAGVELLVYTSIVRADTSSLLLAAEHRGTEAVLRERGLPFVFLRNSWYLELYTEALPTTLANGAIIGSAGGGRVSAATRADYAEAAAAVLADPHARPGAVYELGGDEAFTMADLAAEISAQSGRAVTYQDMPEEAYRGTLAGFGLPDELAAVFADADRGLAAGELLVEGGDLGRLIGRPTTTMAEAVATAVAALAAPAAP